MRDQLRHVEGLGHLAGLLGQHWLRVVPPEVGKLLQSGLRQEVVRGRQERQRGRVVAGDERVAQSLERSEPLGRIDLQDLLDEVNELEDLPS